MSSKGSGLVAKAGIRRALRVGVIGAVHRLENPGKILLELIEVQTGSYLGEDDIIRIEDDYQRT